MSFLTALKIGFWNAWILMVLLYAASFLPLYIDKDKMMKRGEGEPGWSEITRKSKITFIIAPGRVSEMQIDLLSKDVRSSYC